MMFQREVRAQTAVSNKRQPGYCVEYRQLNNAGSRDVAWRHVSV